MQYQLYGRNDQILNNIKTGINVSFFNKSLLSYRFISIIQKNGFSFDYLELNYN